jgi:hypothetical protein
LYRLLACWQADGSSADTRTHQRTQEQTMIRSVMLAALVVAGFSTASTKEAGAVVYCTYVGYPAGCVVRPGVVLRPRPAARAAVQSEWRRQSGWRAAVAARRPMAG